MDNEPSRPDADTPARPLRRRREGRILSGVAAGLADYLDVDAVLVRIGFAALAILGGVGVPAYLACWLLIPEEGADTTLADELFGRVGDFLEDAEGHLHHGRAR